MSVRREPRRSIAIRFAGPADAEALARLVTAFGGHPVDAAEIGRRMESPAAGETVLLAEQDEQAVGYASLRFFQAVTDDMMGGEVSDLFVLEPFRRRGIGTALVGRAEAIARERGAGGLVIVTGLNNALAQEFYHNLGFEISAVFLRKRFSPELRAPGSRDVDRQRTQP